MLLKDTVLAAAGRRTVPCFIGRPGSIGASADPSRVFKGTKMGGHMGNVRKTIQNLQVWQVRSDRNLLLLKGSIPGSKNGFVLIKQAKKKSA